MADILRGDLVEAGTDLPSRWQVTDDRAAEWAMRHVARLTNELEKLKQQHDAWVNEVRDWYDREARTITRGLAYFDGQLRTYALARRVLDEDAKTLRLPSGEVRTRASQPTLRITDEAALIAYLKPRHADLVRTREDVLVSTLKEAVTFQHGPAVYSVSMDCGDTFDSDTDDLKFCPLCGAEGLVVEVDQVVFEQWWATLGGLVVPGVEVVQPHTNAEVVVR
jgi:phage host-nuclease inhibitor protein Gam